MDLHHKIFCIVLLISSRGTKICLHGAPAEGIIINTELSGQELIKMGNVMNKPLLSLLGATFVKTDRNMNEKLSERIGATEEKLQDGIDKLTKDASNEREVIRMELCKQTQCAEWTEWSSCSANYLKTFGARTRSRMCGVFSSICSKESVEKNETDYQICQGKNCKHTLIKNNYCIKLYKSVKKMQKDAKVDCDTDGGHLMNIDSALKAKDIGDYLESVQFTEHIWIDGTRTIPNGDWKYEYSSKDSTFSMWHSAQTEPDSDDDCKTFGYTNGKWEWWGKRCTSSFYHLCEII